MVITLGGGGNQFNIFDTMLNYDPSNPTQIPRTNSQIADLICHRFARRVASGYGTDATLAGLLSKNTEVDLVAKEKLSHFISNNPDLPSFAQAKVNEGKMQLGKVKCSPGSSLVRALRER